MPFSGFDPQEHGALIDVSGGGSDPSAYYALSPGGRFPGDLYAYLESLGALSRGTAGANPDYDVPDFLQNLPGVLGRLFRGHEQNVRNGGTGDVSYPLGGYPYQFFSGPAAQFGPPGGPLHGLVDMGNPDIWDFPERAPDPPPSPPGRGRRQGAGPVPPSTLPTYRGAGHSAQFLDWQPVQTFGDPSAGRPGQAPPASPSRFVPGQGQGPAPAPPRSREGAGPGQTLPLKPAAPRKPARAGQPANPGGPAPTTGSGSGNPYLDFLARLFGGLTPAGSTGGDPASGSPGRREPGSLLGRPDLRGVNTGNLDLGSPGWIHDPTTGINNTAGFPLGTPNAPRLGQSWDDYAASLHDQGFSTDDILSLIGGRYGFTGQGGDWDWNWGTGPVMRGPNGYDFARNLGSSGGGSPGGVSGTMEEFFQNPFLV